MDIAITTVHAEGDFIINMYLFGRQSAEGANFKADNIIIRQRMNSV